MRIEEHNFNLSPTNVWEDLVQDFLEMACFLSEDEQRFLIEELKRQPIRATAIHAFPTFSIDGRAVIICEEASSHEECWLYHPKRKTIEKFGCL